MFQEKTVLITGGASGMGFLCGKCFAREGAKIVLADVNGEALDRCVQEIKEITPHVIGTVTDVRDYAQVTACCESAIAAFGSIDVLIAAAGGAEARLCNVRGDFFEQPIEVIDFGLDLNLKGAIYFDHAVMKQMKKQGSGVIINFGSITGEEGSPSNIAYAASKSALMNGVVKSLAQAGGKYGVRAVCIAPGPVLTRAAMANMKTLVGRAAEPEEIVDLILYMASEKGAFVNGTTILIDGGRSVMFNKK